MRTQAGTVEASCLAFPVKCLLTGSCKSTASPTTVWYPTCLPSNPIQCNCYAVDEGAVPAADWMSPELLRCSAVLTVLSVAASCPCWCTPPPAGPSSCPLHSCVQPRRTGHQEQAQNQPPLSGRTRANRQEPHAALTQLSLICPAPLVSLSLQHHLLCAPYTALNSTARRMTKTPARLESKAHACTTACRAATRNDKSVAH
jgi:hypothetical protein